MSKKWDFFDDKWASGKKEKTNGKNKRKSGEEIVWREGSKVEGGKKVFERGKGIFEGGKKVFGRGEGLFEVLEEGVEGEFFGLPVKVGLGEKAVIGKGL